MSSRLPTVLPSVVLPKGFAAAGLHCGLKSKGARDLGLLLADAPTPVAALFTQNRLTGAHIPVCRDHLQRSNGLARAILVNARNANCATGEQGIAERRHVVNRGAKPRQIDGGVEGVTADALVERAIRPPRQFHHAFANGYDRAHWYVSV